jgi:hypothetical protein
MENADTTPVASGASDFDSLLSASVDAAVDTPTPATDPAPEPEPLAAPEPDADPEPEQVDQVTEPEQQPEQATDEPEAELDPADELTPDRVSDNGKTLHFSKQKAERLLAARDFQTKVAEVIPNASVEEIQKHYNRSVTASEMVADFDSGDPDRVGKWADFWLGEKASQQSVITFAQIAAHVLPQAHPEAFAVIEKAALGGLAQRLYDEARQTGNEQALFLAQHLDVRTRGRFISKENLAAQNPEDAERQQFYRERDQWNNERRAEMQRQQATRSAQVDQAISGVKSSVIDEALDKVAASFKDKPQWKHMHRDLVEHIDQALSGNPAFQRQINLQKSKAVQDPSGNAQKELEAMMRQFAKQVVDKHRKGVIEAATGTVISASKQAHEVAQQTAARKEPTPSQAPVHRSTLNQKVKNASGYDDAWKVLESVLK